MADIKIDSFVRKFKLLRGAGVEASLNVETKLGEVCISLSCKIGRDILPPTPKSPTDATATSRKYRSPAYYRRQARRKAARQAQCEAEESSVAVEACQVDNTNEVGTSDDGVMDESTLMDKDDSVTDVEVMDDMELSEKTVESEEVTEKSTDQISLELDSLIRQSKENRERWDKFNALPP